MLFSPSEFFNLFFSELDRLSIPYVVLHTYEDLPGRIESDVDYAVMTRDLAALAGIQRRLAQSCGAVLAHTIEAHIDAIYTVVIDPQNPARFLQLDACGHYVERDRRLVTDTELLEGRRRFKSFYVPAPEVEFAYLLAKALAKGTDLAPRIPKLRGLARLNPIGSQAKFTRLTGDPTPLATWFERPAENWVNLSCMMLRRHTPRFPDRMRELSRGLRRVLCPKGFHIGLVGGTDEARQRLREGVGPILERAFFRRQVFYDFASTKITSSRQGQPCCGAARIVQWTKQYFKSLLPAKVRNELVFSEGGVEELAEDATQYGIQAIGRLGGLLAPYAPRPDLTILLSGKSLMTDDASNPFEDCKNRYLILSEHQMEEAQVATVVQRAIQLLSNREQH